MLDLFGEREVNPPRSQHQRPKRENKELQALRSKKKELKKARKALFKKQGSASIAYRLVNEEYFSTMRQHSQLARALNKKAKARFSATQQRKFRIDPRKFCKKLFQKKSFGEPDFPEEKAFDYFFKPLS
jgi:hypothetical protein